MQQPSINCADTRWLDLVDYLATLGYQPKKISGQDYWYLSPLRDEKLPSFKVNRKLNLWYDHGLGKGGNFMDFGLLYHHCSVPQLLQKLSVDRPLFSFHLHPGKEVQSGIPEDQKLQVLEVKSAIHSLPLKAYLAHRRIPLSIANRYCQEVIFQLKEKPFTAIGFLNQAGGYELRNRFFKGSSAPKSITILEPEKSKSLSVFEGFFSFLSYQTLMEKEGKKTQQKLPEGQPHFLILNSLSFLEKSRPIMEKYEHIHLYLDQDKAGRMATRQALNWSSQYQDQSYRYRQHKDLNDYLVQRHGRQYRQQFSQGNIL